ncbi:MAG: hypothetical protein AAFX09_05950 [Pseudomonadota bacterium]
MMDFEPDREDGPADGAIARLLDEIPLLFKARAFADSVKDPAFFSRLGEALDHREQTLARAYLDGLGFPDAEAAPLGDWLDAVGAAETLDRDPLAWEAEEMLRTGLVEAALERLDAEAVELALNHVAAKIGEIAREAAEAAAAIDDVYDEAVVNAAAGGLAQAANGAVLVLLAEAEDEDPPHPFLARWRLYVRGRWPVGVAGSTYNIL